MLNAASIAQRNRVQAIWTNEETLATTLLVLFTDTYGLEACYWEPTTIFLELQDDVGEQVPQANFDRLMVAIQLLLSDDFYKSLPDFINFCNVLSGDTYDPEQWDPADTGEIAWGITEALLISPPEEDDPFVDEIRAYIGAALDAEGINNPPDILRLALRDNRTMSPNFSEFSDDPEMFDAVYDLEATKTQDIEQFLRGRLRTLSQQLHQLPLRQGNTQDVVRRMLGSLNRT